MDWHQWSLVGKLIGIACSFAFVSCAFLGFGPGARVKSNWLAFGTLLAIWLWTTTIWATHTKLLAEDELFVKAIPSPGFWLTFAPQVLSCVFFVLLSCLKGADIFSGVFSLSKSSLRFHVAGSAYFCGQLFTIVALTRSDPSIVFVVKALEPLSTALLAIPTLRKPFKPGLFMGLAIACSGIMLTGMGSSGATASKPWTNLAWSVGCVFACLGNLGFSVRQCLVKSFYEHEGRSALETFGKVGLAGTAWGTLPLLSYAIITAFTHNSSTPTTWWGSLHLSPRPQTSELGFLLVLSTFHTRWVEWLCVVVCYFLYQASSLLILECIAVESHALLCGMKQVFSVVTVSIILGTPLAPATLMGLCVVAVGVLIFATQNTSGLEKNHSADLETPLLKSKLGSEDKGIPTVLYCISGSLMLTGCLSSLIP